jgi:NAD(P)H-flavin reductase
MLSIARELARERSLDDRRLYLFFGGREPRDILWEALFNRIPELGSRVVNHASISVPGNDSDRGWTGARGLIHDLVAGNLAGRFQEL